MTNNLNSARSASNPTIQSQVRTYTRGESVVFLKTKEKFGGLSNMASGFPLQVNGVHVRSSEALYQACRFPHLPDVQRLIIKQVSPMTAKMVGKPYRKDSRPDWDRVRVKIMRWCLRVKLAQNWNSFSTLLLSTGDRSIVEESRKDEFWGAKPVDKDTLVGMNVLGRLLMELREQIKQRNKEPFECVEPLAIPDFLLLGKLVTVVESHLLRSASANNVSTLGKVLEPTIGGILQSEPTSSWLPSSTDATGHSKFGLMVNELRPYNEYRATDIPWAPRIPASWSIQRAKWLFTKMDRPALPNDEVVTCFRDGTVTLRRNRRVRGFTEAIFELGYQGIRKGDLVIHGMDAFAGAIGVSDSNGKGSPVYSVCQPKSKANTSYYAHVLREMARSQWIIALSKGIRERSTEFRYETFGDQCVPLPSPDEQLAIGRFLNQVTFQVDRLIRTKKKAMALLQELTQAVINNAVTRGVGVNISLSKANIPWLPEIPKHWKIQPLKQLLGRMDYGTSENLGENGKVRVLTMGNIKDGEIVLPQHGSLNSVPPGLRLEHNDLLFNRTNSPELVGKVGIFTGTGTDDVTFASYLVRLRVSDEHNPIWLNYLLNSAHFWTYARSQALVSLHQANLNSSRYGQMTIPVPPKKEQDVIAERITAKVAQIRKAINRTEREVDVIREFRTRLTADVVTGKLDVREAAAQLSAETELLKRGPTDDEPADSTDVIEEEQTA